MKIVVSAKEPDMASPFEPRFGRAANFVFVDTETGEWEGLANPAMSAGGGAGVQAAQFVANRGAETVVSGDFGPNAFATLNAAGLKMFVAREGSVAELVAQFKAGELREVGAATRAEGLHHHGGGWA